MNERSREELLEKCEELIEQESRNPVSRTIRYEDVWAVARALKSLLSLPSEAAVGAERNELELTAAMLDTHAVEHFPEVKDGKVHFIRAVMESAAETIRQALRIAPPAHCTCRIDGGERIEFIGEDECPVHRTAPPARDKV